MPPLNHRDLLPRDLDPKQDPSLAELNSRFKEIIQHLNVQAGYYGTAQVFGNINLNGNRITNVGEAQETTDVLTQSSADPMYSTSVQQAAMEAVGNRMLQTTRRLNDGTQQHTVSSDLNTQGSIPPSNITGTLAWTSTASSITFTWTSVVVQLADLSYKAIKDGTLTVTGLSGSYAFYPYRDMKLGILSFVADSVNASGAPPIAFTAAGYSPAAQAQNQDGRIALTTNAPTPQTATTGMSGMFQLRSQT